MYRCRLPSLVRTSVRPATFRSLVATSSKLRSSVGVITPSRLYSSLITPPPYHSSSSSSSASTFTEPPLNIVEQIHGRRLQEGKLVLEDGETITGTSFGDFRSVAGEVVFNTGMVGYAESLTDPSYKGQILVMTYPLIGNYGIPDDTRDQYGLLEHFESDRIHIRGLIVSDYCEQYSHWKATRSLGHWLQQHNIPALFGIDTRALTQRIRDKTKGIRDKSSLLGKIIADTDVPFEDPNLLNLVAQVSTTGAKTYGRGDVNILALDVGMKNSIIRKLTQRGAAVTVVPWDYDIVNAMEKYDGLLISNGPGDPSTPKLVLENLKKLMSQPNPKPIFGICLGHQLLATAAGGNTYKMRYGHRGHNQPCIDLTDQRCYITSQNHGYAVDPSSISADWEPYFINANDQTSEGVRHKWKPIWSAQFHPEGSGGPEDTSFLFDRFLHAIRLYKGNNKIYTVAKAAIPTATPQPPASAVVDEKIRDGATLGATLSRGKPMASFIKNHIQTPVEPTSTTPTSTPITVTDIPFVPKKVLVLGSGGLQIGQAGEFDYSGSQAIKALKEENIESILINPNIATVQTAKGLADRVYFNPVTPDFVESLIEKERPDGIFLQFGGQTALNCGIELDRRGVLSKYGVRVMGTTVETIIATEDRDIFKAKLQEIGEPIAKSVACTSVDEAVASAASIGYPVIARAAFSLGGLGSGFAHNAEELTLLCQKAFTASSQVLIERSMRGWKEVEYEVVRDGKDNCVTVCNMENFDPLGIHTGDSIVVAPSQTMDDVEYHLLRRASIRIARHLGIIGECNVQYALHPTSKQYIVIEVNPRLSRSSALASKATGYPLAFVAAKIALGKSLTQIKNSITQVTAACFEPSLDYIVVKIPRWDLQKFSNANNKLGSGMKSVGEVMGIGRSFEEAFQKAIRMVDPSSSGFDTYNTKHKINTASDAELNEIITNATDHRLYALAQAYKRGYTNETIHNMSKIDYWFLKKLERMYRVTNVFEKLSLPHLSDLPANLLRLAKEYGFSDKQLGLYLKKTPDSIRSYRKSLGIIPVTKQIDTLAAEYPAMTNYLYTTYHGTTNDVDFKDHGILTLGSGCYAIGNSVEFDYSAVSTIRTLRKLGKKTIMLNYNPETVSTDYDESDRLYFDELSLERVLDVCDQEKPEGVVVSVGGQIPNNLAVPLNAAGVKLLGTSAAMIDQAEDRSKFSETMDAIGVSQPQWAALTSIDAAHTFCKRVGFPVLVRPSYVLSGAAMKVVRDETALEEMLANAKNVSNEYPVVISKFIQGAKEVDIDGVAKNGETVVFAVSEHVEQAGVHSGDATLVFPAQDLTSQQYNTVVEIGKKVAKALKINGPYNAQFIVNGNDISIIECNVRASRSFPFVSKVLDVDFIALATRIMLGGDAANIDPEEVAIDLSRLNFVAVKVPQFSFPRLGGADPITGVEMASTGEVACYGATKEEAFLKGLMAANQKLPTKKILIIAGDEQQKLTFLPSTQKLIKMGYELYATPGTAQFLRSHQIPVNELSLGRTTIDSKASGPSVLDVLAKRGIDYFFTFPSGSTTGTSHSDLALQYRIRRAAIDYSIPVCNNVQVANLLVNALYTVKELSVLGSHELVHSIKP